METKRSMVYLRLELSERARWDAAAKLRGVSLSWLIRHAVDEFLDEAFEEPEGPGLSMREVVLYGGRDDATVASIGLRPFTPDFKGTP